MKTIEESAHECALEIYGYLTRSNRTKDEIVDAIQGAYLRGSGHLMSLPLGQRLTAEEREKVDTMRKCIGSKGAQVVLNLLFNAEKGGEK